QESGDDEYRGEHSDSDDEVDSDFDIDEGDEPGSEQDEAEPRRRRRVLTKAYREPLKSLRAKKAEGPRGASQRSREVKSVPLELQEDVGDSECGVGIAGNGVLWTEFLLLQGLGTRSERALGDPSWEWDAMGELLVLQGLGSGSQGSVGAPDWENYERLEADKKKQVQKKRKIVGPVIRYWSLTMPLLPEPGRDDPVDVEGLDPESHAAAAAAAPPSPGKCSRTFISFSDDATFERCFPRGKAPRLPARELCPVTHKPALYRDPITDIPYSNARAFRIIREAYRKYVTAHGLPSAAAMAESPGARPGRQKIVIKQSVPSA
ncbi:VPS72 protein, partial [Irena cyanogastra]|nr:VPS72 protein [Irena cyanogastra]